VAGFQAGIAGRGQVPWGLSASRLQGAASGLPAPAPRQLGGRGPSGFQPAIVRAHSRACMVSVINGNSRRSSTAAASSPLCSKAVRIAADLYLGDDDHRRSIAIAGHNRQAANG
jgi:hypothetical protein